MIATKTRENITFREANQQVARRFIRPRRSFSAAVQQTGIATSQSHTNPPNSENLNTIKQSIPNNQRNSATETPIISSKPETETQITNQFSVLQDQRNRTMCSPMQNHLSLLRNGFNPLRRKSLSTRGAAMTIQMR